ncbi:MAG TPA: energy-dependent translational throttle protein EttA [Thermoanaerobaculia bacterium]|nr:energy-dependent translational throttle protein EttA [Thermoanaerobaculia bacterium]
MAQQYIFTMQNLRKVVPPHKEILRGVWLSFYPGAKIGVLGLNGAGKSTVLRIMAGEDSEFQGEAYPAEGTRIGYLPQDPKLDPSKDVLGNVEMGVAPIRALLSRFDELNEKLGSALSDAEMEKVMAEHGKVQDAIDAAGGWDLDKTLELAMDALRCPPPDADVTKISGGEKRRVALCKVLLEKPDMLLLDEPTNHLDAESVAWLERHLAEFPGTVVAVTHDRYFLDNVAQWILELDRGAGIPWKGNYSSWLEQKEARLATEEKQESAKRRALQRELEWVRMSPRARHAKSKARLEKYESLLNEQGPDARNETQEIYIPPGPRLGDVVVRAEHVRKSYGDRVLMDDLNFDLPRGGIVGVIGPNGAGKTTLFRMIMGEEKPDAGKLTVGDTVVASYVDQNRERPDAGKTVHDELSQGQDLVALGKRTIPSRAYCAMFNFKGADQQKKVADLSGGEMNRLHLARTLKKGGNLLLLDEPTNDLDVETLRALEEAVLGFGGCAVIISHDRWFLDRVATHILAFEGDSQTTWFEGNFADYEADRKRRLGAEADRPHRIKYKKLTRA